MGISDMIAAFIQSELESSDVVELQRGDLAQRFGCVPSQINYVMTTRFSPERGYIVESRRGGGGYIRISRVRMDRETLLMHVINAVGDELDLPSARAMVTNLCESGAISVEAGRCILSAISERSLQAVPRAVRGAVRSDIVKQVLIQLV